ncbi:Fur family transcriptional regulator [Aquipuribacter sp. SD81]|uniref:Fur family transcriptional regulator n=1 Tax=Aquipuribacter sp. SD81 TaxID=3127703 RepID=UPI00301659D3
MSSTTAPAASPARRNTRQRAAVVAALQATEEFVSAQDLHATMREGGERVGLATVYRSLQQLSDDERVDVRRGEDGEALYRLCSTGHHHHLVCRVCGATVEVESSAVERWASRLAAEHGYTDAAHTVEVTGTCPRCSAHPGTA